MLADVKFEPVMVTVEPLAPLVGVRLVIAGAPLYENRSALRVALVPPEFETVMSTVPVPAGAVAVMLLPDGLTITLVAGVEPKMTVLPLAKLVPVIVTVDPVTPVPGETLVIKGTVEGALALGLLLPPPQPAKVTGTSSAMAAMPMRP